MAAAVGQPICIPAVRFIAVRLLGLPLHLFTTDPTATRLSALPRHRVRQWLLPGRRYSNCKQTHACLCCAGHCARCGRAQPAAAHACDPAIRWRVLPMLVWLLRIVARRGLLTLFRKQPLRQQTPAPHQMHQPARLQLSHANPAAPVRAAAWQLRTWTVLGCCSSRWALHVCTTAS